MNLQYRQCAKAMTMRIAMLAPLVLAGMQGQTLTREYIHLGGRVIAVENAAATVTPSSLRLGQGQSATFVASFSGAVWTLSPTAGTGTITTGGVYTAPATVSTEMPVTVEARQSAGGAVLSTATVVLEPQTLVVTPSTATAQPGEQVSFGANMAATWSLSPATGAGTINATTGLYQAPATISASQSITVNAVSTGNPAKSGLSALTLWPASGICTLSTLSLAFGPSTAGKTITLSGCPTGYDWTSSTSGATWITVNPASGTGNRTVTVSPQTLPGSTPRTGSIVIDGRTVNVRQDPACTNSFGNKVVGSPLQAMSGQVNCAAGVQWSSSAGGATWLRLNPASGTGTVSTTLSVDAYTGTGTRTATVTVASNSFTVTQHGPCSVSPLTVSLGGGADSKNVALTCSTAAPWTTVASQGWLHATPAAGTGSATLAIAGDPNGTGASRPGTVTVDGKTINVTQAVSTLVTLSATSVTLNHGEQYQFEGAINGTWNTAALTWTVESGPGSFTAAGKYQAPATVEPTNHTAVIRATDVTGGGTATATITLNDYAPPGSITISPVWGSALSWTLTFTVGNSSGVTLTELNGLISPGITQLQNACSILVKPGSSPGPEVRVLENAGSAYTLPMFLGQTGATWVENSQCRVTASGSSVTVNGTTTTVQLAVLFKPGFIGSMVTGASTLNSTGYTTQMAQLGTWDLSANVAAQAPSADFTAPASGATVTGDVVISGWALDNATSIENGIANVQVYIDNVLKTEPVTRNLASTACTTYPTRTGCPNVGWSYTWNSRLAPNGSHTIKVVATDGDNPAHTKEITRTVTVNNPPSTPITVQPATTFARMLLNGGYNPAYPQFTAYRGATVLSPVTWSLNPSYWSYGSISSSGVYTPAQVGYNPVGTSVQIVAANPSDATDKGTATAILMGVLANGSYLLSLSAGQQAQFMTSLGSVNYTLSPNLGSITYYGVYTHPGSGFTPGTIVTITATQVGNSNNREVAYVRLW